MNMKNMRTNMKNNEHIESPSIEIIKKEIKNITMIDHQKANSNEFIKEMKELIEKTNIKNQYSKYLTQVMQRNFPCDKSTH